MWIRIPVIPDRGCSVFRRYARVKPELQKRHLAILEFSSVARNQDCHAQPPSGEAYSHSTAAFFEID